MKKTYPYLLFLAAISCSKKETDNIAPVITITSPAAARHYALGDTIQFKAIISDNIEVKSVTLRIIDSVIFSIEPATGIRTYEMPVNKKDYPFSHTQLVAIAFKTAWRYTLSANDLQGNTTVAELIFPMNQ